MIASYGIEKTSNRLGRLTWLNKIRAMFAGACGALNGALAPTIRTFGQFPIQGSFSPKEAPHAPCAHV